MADIVCANCGLVIDEGDEYFVCGDNFLQIKYFDDYEGKDNIFCSKECFCESLSLMSRYNKKDNNGEDYDEEY